MDERGQSRLPLILAAVVGLVLIIALRAVFSGGGGSGGNGGGDDEVDQAAPTREGCVGVTVAASSEKAALLGQIATAFERDDPQVQGRCVDMRIVSKSSGGAAEALAAGWDEAADGPRPDVWSPAGSGWVVILRQRLAERDAANIVPDSFESVTQTPLVIAMPRPMAEAMGWPDAQIGWSDILSLSRDPAGWGKFGHPEWGAFRLGKTNPNFSTSGLNATVGAYFAATGLSSDLTSADIADPKVREFVQGVESSVVHYGDITLTFLANLQKADDRGQGLTYISAVTVEEKSVWDYNQGNPSGDPKTLGDHPAPRTKLVAIYPKEGTLVSDNPYVVLNAAWVDEAKKEAASMFLEFLQTDREQRRFQEFAFRDFEGRPGDRISRENGLLPDQPAAVLSPPAPSVLNDIQRSWEDLRKRARVLMVLDVSGSMGESVGSAGSSKLELAKQAAIRALDQFAADDELAVWIFSSEDRSGQPPYSEIAPMQPVGQAIDQIRQRIAGLAPRGGTALYATGKAAVRSMRERFDPARINAVVLLTDGKNEYPPDTDLDGFLRMLDAESEQTAVRVFPIAYGKDADLATLERIAEASRAAAYNAANPATIDKVFTAVISNF